MLHVNQILSKMKQLFLKVLPYNTSSFTLLGLFKELKGVLKE